MKHRFIFPLTAACLLALAGPAFAKHHKANEHANEAKTQETGSGLEGTAGVLADIVLSDKDKKIIQAYYGGKAHGDSDDDAHKSKKGKKGKSGSMPAGLAKRDELPPGLQKHLEKNGTLPPGLAKRDLPDDLLRQLGGGKGGRHLIVGSDVVLIDPVTDRVLDILIDVVR